MSADSLTHTSLEQRVVCEGADVDGGMYDPFYPTEGVKGDEGNCEKYDPFDPTGSPASDIDDRGGKVGGIYRNGEQADDDLEESPDSTDALTGLASPCQITAVAWRHRVDSNSIRTQEKTDSDESDHSEIEEGEIIGAADRNGSAKRLGEDISPYSSTRVSFLGSKPERILRVLDGDGFVSVCTDANWKTERQTEDEPPVEVEDLRSKLVSRRKERYLKYPPSSSLSPQAPVSPSNPLTVTPTTHFTSHVDQSSTKYKFSKSSIDTDQLKSKNKNPGEKEERKKKKRKKDEGLRECSKDKDREQKEAKRPRNSRSSSRKARKRHQSSLDASRTWKSEKKDRAGNLLIHSEEGKREGAWNKDRDDKDKDRHRGRDKHRRRERERERERSHTNSRRRDEREKESSSQKKNKEIKGRQHSSTREHGKSKRSKRSRERRETGKDVQRDRDWRRDGRPVVPPSIQDLNGSDLFAIKRTITVTTTTTTTVPGSPRLAPASPCRPTEKSTKHHKKKKRKWHPVGEVEDRHSQSQSLSPQRYHSYESDHYSDKLEIDVLSLDGEALDSDYPSLEDTPPAALPPESPVPSPKTKTNSKTEQHHTKKKLQTLKKNCQSESSSPSRSKNKCLSSLTVTSGSATVSSGLGLAKRARKIGKDKDRDKGSRKNLVRSGKLKKEGGRKSKLQSKVSVLVREGVSSTTGPSVSSGKMGIDLLGPGGTSVGSGSSVVGGSIAVVFCRDNESRSPFLKPCSEPLSLNSCSKDLANMEKRNRLAAQSSLTSPARLKPKKTKQSSITSTSSLASSPSSSLTNKGRRRKKNKEKSKATGSTAGDVNPLKTTTESWSGPSLDVQSAAGEGRKSVSPHTSQAGPTPCSSSASSSSIIVLPPSSSPPHTPPSSVAPLQDTRESSPDSQTVDSSCKTPDLSFLAEECPSQTSPNLPASGAPSISVSHGSGLSITLSTPTAKSLPPDNASKSLISPPCLSSSAGCGLGSLSLPLSSSDHSSSSVSSSSASKPPPPLPPTSPALPWSLQTGVDCTTGGVLACEFPLALIKSSPCCPAEKVFNYATDLIMFTHTVTFFSKWCRRCLVDQTAEKSSH